MFTFITPKMLLNFLKWGAIIAAIISIFMTIKSIGVNEEKLKQIPAIEKKLELQNDVQKTVNRVVSDPDYRERVRDKYDTTR